jgi:uncharacterized SAM-binding protein YcdF (DUF218 family)
MVNLVVVLVIYLLLILANIFYIKKTRSQVSKLDIIVVLSGDFNWDTVKRLERVVVLLNKFPTAMVAICGKGRSALMQEHLRRNGVAKFITQDRSTNTCEDAVYLLPLLPPAEKITLGLVTSSPHQRRAYHTFKRIFPKTTIYNFPTSDFINLYSPLFPLGWVANLLNIFKDWRYNGQIW